MTDKLFPLVFVALWSSAFVTGKFIVHEATPFAALCLRFAIVGAGYAAYAAARRESLRIAKQDVAHALFISALFHGFYLSGVFFAISRGMPAGLAALIVTLQPVLATLLARPLLGEFASARQWCGIGLGLGGVILVLGLDLPERLPASASIAIVIALLAITAGALWQKKTGSRISLTASNFYQAVSAIFFHAAAIALLERSPVITLALNSRWQ